MRDKSIIFFQSLEAIRGYLDFELWDLKKTVDIDNFYSYLIAKTLFKTGSWNTVFKQDTYYEVIRNKLVSNCINSAGIRYVDNLILDYISLPRTNGDDILTISVRGDVLIAKYNQTKPIPYHLLK